MKTNLTAIIGIVIIAAAMVVFYVTANRNISDLTNLYNTSTNDSILQGAIDEIATWKYKLWSVEFIGMVGLAIAIGSMTLKKRNRRHYPLHN